MRIPLGAAVTVFTLALLMTSGAQAQTVTIQVTSLITMRRDHDRAPKGKVNKGDSVDFRDVLVNLKAQFGKKAGIAVAYDVGTMTYTSGTTTRITVKATFPKIGTITYSGRSSPSTGYGDPHHRRHQGLQGRDRLGHHRRRRDEVTEHVRGHGPARARPQQQRHRLRFRRRRSGLMAKAACASVLTSEHERGIAGADAVDEDRHRLGEIGVLDPRTFSALRSPERERLKEPMKATSSTTVTFACMKSWTSPVP
jgi:hypothetical protein